jgi:hypothetical protein
VSSKALYIHFYKIGYVTWSHDSTILASISHLQFSFSRASFSNHFLFFIHSLHFSARFLSSVNPNHPSELPMTSQIKTFSIFSTGITETSMQLLTPAQADATCFEGFISQ